MDSTCRSTRGTARNVGQLVKTADLCGWNSRISPSILNCKDFTFTIILNIFLRLHFILEKIFFYLNLCKTFFVV